MPDLNQFAEWQKGNKSRSIEIKINARETRIWAYDSSMEVGQFVQSVDEIDLAARKEQKERAEFERLRAKFEVKEKSSATGNGKED